MRNCFFQSGEVPTYFLCLIPDIVNERTFQSLARVLVIEFVCERLQNRQVGRPFQVENTSSLFCLIEVIETDLGQRFQYFATTIVNAMRFPHECDEHVLASRFIQYHFRMTCSDYLVIVLSRNTGN